MLKMSQVNSSQNSLFLFILKQVILKINFFYLIKQSHFV